MDYNDIFDDDGMLAVPTVRGSANLDVEDYEGFDGRSSILDDELEEDIPSTPGRNPGAAAATDVDGTGDFDMLEVPGGMSLPGMKQTDYGASPWGPGSGSGYRPFSQARTDMELRALGEEGDMPEIIDTEPAEKPVSWEDEWHGMRNRAPSNAEVDPLTIYDRESYEYEGSSQDVIGSGIFAMEEGVTFRPRDGIFANQYAQPQYIAAEDELGVQQSEMWDSTAGEWRVTQPSASGVSLARRVSAYKPPPAGVPGGGAPGTFTLRPESTGVRSHIEAFGRKAAKVVVEEARYHRPENRSAFLKAAIESLDPGTVVRCQKTADRLIEMGYRPEVALEDSLAHCIMHAVVKDVTQPKISRGGSLLPRLDRMAVQVQQKSGDLRDAATRHIAPLTNSPTALKEDLKNLNASPAASGIGQVSENAAVIPQVSGGGVFTAKNLAIAGGLGVVGFLLFKNRKKIAKNLKQFTK